MAPDAVGPMMPGMTQHDAIAANSLGRIVAGMYVPTTTYTAVIMPPPEMPWIARPSTSATIVVAVPATTSPEANTTTNAMIGVRGPWRSHR